MERWIKSSGCALFVAALSLLCSNETRAMVYSKPPFEYRLQRADDKTIQQLDQELHSRLQLMQSNLGMTLSGLIRIDVTMTREEFDRLTQNRVPNWAGGVAFQGQNRIVLKTPLFFDEGVPVGVLAAHELAHILLDQAAHGGDLPRWFQEGMASLMAGETRAGSLGRLGRAAAGDRLMGLPRVDWVLGFTRPDADLAYAEARFAAQYLVDGSGWEGVRKILIEVSGGREFEEAFKLGTGVEYETWQVEWLDWAKSRFRSAVLMEFDNLIWLVIFLLGVTAMIAVHIRRRLQFKKWLEEENEDGFPDDDQPIVP